MFADFFFDPFSVFESATRIRPNNNEPHLDPFTQFTRNVFQSFNDHFDSSVRSCMIENQRTFRSHSHSDNRPVPIVHRRLQWYDSATNRALVPIPPTRLQPSGCLSTSELARLPLSTIVKRKLVITADSDKLDGRTEGQNNASVVSNDQTNSKGLDTSFRILPVSKSVSELVVIELPESVECEICLVEYRHNDRLRHLPCKHAFHAKCIDSWLKQASNCPKCRSGIRTGLRRLQRQAQKAQSIARLETKYSNIRSMQNRPLNQSVADAINQPSTSLNHTVRSLETRSSRMRAAFNSSLLNADNVTNRNHKETRLKKGGNLIAESPTASRNKTRSDSTKKLSDKSLSCSETLSVLVGVKMGESKDAFARRMAGEAAVRRAMQTASNSSVEPDAQ